MKAKDIMNPHPLTVQADATIQELVNLFNDQRVDGVCVVGDDNKLVGVVSIYELLLAFIPDYVKMKKELVGLVREGFFEKRCAQLKDQPVRSVMRTDVIRILEDDTLIHIVGHIVHYRLMVVPVTRGDILVGTIHKKGLFGYAGKVLIEGSPT